MTITIDYNNDRVILETENQRIVHDITGLATKTERLIGDILNMLGIENDTLGVSLIREDENSHITIREW